VDLLDDLDRRVSEVLVAYFSDLGSLDELEETK